MFASNGPRREFGQWAALLPVLSSVIQVGGGIGQALIAKGTAESVAKTQSQTALGTAAVQERIAQLQLQAVQTKAVAEVQKAEIESGGGITGAVSSITGAIGLGGISPLIFLVIGGGAIFILMRRRKGHES
jgi:hypothetical protein